MRQSTISANLTSIYFIFYFFYFVLFCVWMWCEWIRLFLFLTQLLHYSSLIELAFNWFYFAIVHSSIVAWRLAFADPQVTAFRSHVASRSLWGDDTSSLRHLWCFGKYTFIFSFCCYCFIHVLAMTSASDNSSSKEIICALSLSFCLCFPSYAKLDCLPPQKRSYCNA